MKGMLSFLAGMLCGAAVGSVTALLLTPAAGRDLQGRARTQLDALVEQARGAAAARRAQLQAQLEALKVSRPSAPAAS